MLLNLKPEPGPNPTQKNRPDLQLWNNKLNSILLAFDIYYWNDFEMNVDSKASLRWVC